MPFHLFVRLPSLFWLTWQQTSHVAPPAPVTSPQAPSQSLKNLFIISVSLSLSLFLVLSLVGILILNTIQRCNKKGWWASGGEEEGWSGGGTINGKEGKRRITDSLTYIWATTTPGVLLPMPEMDSIFTPISLTLGYCHELQKRNMINPLWAWKRLTPVRRKIILNVTLQGVWTLFCLCTLLF